MTRREAAITVEVMADTSTTEQAEKVVTVTESAAGQIKHLLESEPENAGKHLRVYVEPGGCSGMQYGMVFDEKRAGRPGDGNAWGVGPGGSGKRGARSRFGGGFQRQFEQRGIQDNEPERAAELRLREIFRGLRNKIRRLLKRRFVRCETAFFSREQAKKARNMLHCSLIKRRV